MYLLALPTAHINPQYGWDDRCVYTVVAVPPLADGMTGVCTVVAVPPQAPLPARVLQCVALST